jgi:hypothetical protein
MPIPTDIALAMLFVAAVLPLYAALDRLARRLRDVERRLDDGAGNGGAQATAAAAWRTRLAVMEAEGNGQSPRALALRRRLAMVEGDGHEL